MGRHQLNLPNALSVRNVKYLFENVQFFPDKPPTELVLSFHPRFTNFEPFAVAMLAAWANYWTKKGVPIRCENTGAKGVAYAQRMGLFSYVPCPSVTPVTHHEEAGRFVPLQHLGKTDDASKMFSEIASILRDPELIKLGQYTLSEITRNVHEHSCADAFICAQYYAKTKQISIGVADCGIGVRESLLTSYGFQTDADAVIGALRPGVSGRSRRPYSADDNAGLGLFVSRALAKASRQYFMLLSGDAAFRLDRPSASRVNLQPLRDPGKEAHSLFAGLKHWQGTLVAINLRGMDRSYNAVMETINAAISEGKDITKTREKIRFE